jgi:hypothetical protein
MCMHQPNRRSEAVVFEPIEHVERDDYDDVFEQEKYRIDLDREDGHYYIGIHSNLLMINSVCSRTFFSHSSKKIRDYLYNYSIIEQDAIPSIDVMKLVIQPDSSYSVVLKTHWLRIVQRNWKRVFALRKKATSTSSSIGLQGMLASLKPMPNSSFVETH